MKLFTRRILGHQKLWILFSARYVNIKHHKMHNTKVWQTQLLHLNSYYMARTWQNIEYIYCCVRHLIINNWIINFPVIQSISLNTMRIHGQVGRLVGLSELEGKTMGQQTLQPNSFLIAILAMSLFCCNINDWDADIFFWGNQGYVLMEKDVLIK